MSSLFCGIDIGSTNLKVLLADGTGATLWTKSVPAPRLHDELGMITDVAALVTLTEDLIIDGWKAVGRGRALTAISSAGIGEDGVCIDNNFRPLGHALPWFDRRGEALAQGLTTPDIKAKHPEIAFDFSSSAGKWLWLHQHRSHEIARDKTWITLTDFPIAYWSATPFMSATLAPRTSCYDIFKRQWISELLEASHAPLLPPLKKAGTPVGTMRTGRLPDSGAANSNTLLVAGGHDHPMAASSIRRIHPDARIDSMGTANASYGETQQLTAVRSLKHFYATLPINSDTGIAVFGMVEISATLNERHGDAGAIYKQIINAKSPDEIDKPIQATLIELSHEMKSHFDNMRSAGVPDGPIYATGGWSRSQGFMELRAAIYDEPLTVIDEPELVALAAAFFAADGAGLPLTTDQLKSKQHIVNP